MKKLWRKDNIKKALARPAYAGQYLRAKLRAKLSYRLGGGYSLAPGRVFFALTGRCNLRCQMCPQEKHPTCREQMRRETELSGDRLRTIIDEMTSFRPLVCVSGGELFLHAAWHDFLSHIKQKGLFCSIGTNGTFLERDATKLVATQVDELSVSIDGLADTHDEIRGIPGTHSKIVNGIRRVMAEKERLGTNKPEITVLFTITPANYTEIEAMVESMAALEVKSMRIGHLNFLGAKDFDKQMRVSKKLFGIERDTSWAGFVGARPNIDARQLIETIEKVRKAKRNGMKICFSPDFRSEEILAYYGEGDFRSTSFKNACQFPWEHAMVGPTGEVILCPNYIIGNLQEESFSEIWNNERARFFRKQIAKTKVLPVCSRGCCFFYT